MTYVLVVAIVYLACLVACATLAIIWQKFLRPYGLYPLVLFLPYVAIQEIILLVYEPPSTGSIYDAYRVINVLVFTVIFANNPILKPNIKLIIGMGAGFVLMMAITYLGFDYVGDPSGYTGLLRSAVLTIFSIVFLYHYFNLDNSQLEKEWKPLLLIVIGILLFYPVSSISLMFQKHLFAKSATLYGSKLYQLIPRIMSICMYPLFSYAFYLCRKNASTLSSR